MPNKAPTFKPWRAGSAQVHKPRNRDPRTKRKDSIHTRAWRRLRRMKLAANPLCEAHLKQGRVVPATDVDHVVSREDGGTDDWDNLMSMCHSCHSRKTATVDGGFGRQRGGEKSTKEPR